MEDRLLKLSFPFSLLFHVIALTMLFYWQTDRMSKQRDALPQPIWVEVERPAPVAKTQVVESYAGEKTKIAPDNAYLGPENRVVERESVAKGRQRGAQAMMQKTPRSDAGATPKLSRLGVPMFPSKPTPNRPDNPNWVDFSKFFGESFPEYVKGVKESERTALNTKEFVYFSYYKRIRDQLDQAWKPILEERLLKFLKSGRSIASEVDHVTKTVVTLDHAGEVVRVQVLEESGIWDLDQSAVDAFNKAGPFPNPPHGLVEGNGNIQIRWDFILKS